MTSINITDFKILSCNKCNILVNDHNKIDTKLEEHSSGTENNIEDISEDLEDPENSLSYALENTLSLEKDKRLVDNLQDNQSKFKFMTAVESLSNKKEEEICDRKPRQKMTHDYSAFLDDESIVSREVSMVGRRAIGRGKISDYSDSLTDESIRGEESLVALRAIGRGRPMSSHAERLRRFRMKGGKTGGRVPKIIWNIDKCRKHISKTWFLKITIKKLSRCKDEQEIS